MKYVLKISAALTVTALLFWAGSVFGQGAQVQAADAFAMLKSLAGNWCGTIEEKDKGPATCVSYRLTADSSVVVETLFPGTDHEMMTMYHMNGDQLMLTHYCAAGNQPRMVLSAQSTPGLLVFDFAGGTNLNAGEDMHMHSGRIKFVTGDKLENEWDAYKGGQKVGTHKFFLSRKK